MRTFHHYDRAGKFLRSISSADDLAAASPLASDGHPRTILASATPVHDPLTQTIEITRHGYSVAKRPLSSAKGDAVGQLQAAAQHRLSLGVDVGGYHLGVLADDQANWVAALVSIANVESVLGKSLNALPASDFIGPVLGHGGVSLNPQPTVAAFRGMLAAAGQALGGLRAELQAACGAINAATDLKQVSTLLDKWLTELRDNDFTGALK